MGHRSFYYHNSPTPGMSRRAHNAYAEGLVTKSRITKALLEEEEVNTTVKNAKRLIESGEWRAREWHHTSKYGNETKFYSLEDLKEMVNEEEEEEEIEFVNPVVVGYKKFVKRIEGVEVMAEEDRVLAAQYARYFSTRSELLAGEGV